MTDSRNLTPKGASTHIPNRENELLWFILGACSALAVVLLYLEWRY